MLLYSEEIHREIGDYLAGQGNDADSTDGVFNFLENLTSLLQDDFDKFIGEDTYKKCFVKALASIFVAFVADKIKRILRIAVEKTLKIWQGPK